MTVSKLRTQAVIFFLTKKTLLKLSIDHSVELIDKMSIKMKERAEEEEENEEATAKKTETLIKARTPSTVRVYACC